MKNFLNPARGTGSLPFALALVLGLGWLPCVAAETLSIYGKWAPDVQAGANPAAPALTIKGSTLRWGAVKGAQPACSREFVLKEERPGTVYTNGRGTKFVAGTKGSLPTFLLAIGASTCEGAIDQIRISFPVVYDSRHIDVLELERGKVVASRRYYRLK